MTSKKSDIKHDYDLLKENVPEIFDYTFDEFLNSLVLI